jgi:hypothetical protein
MASINQLIRGTTLLALFLCVMPMLGHAQEVSFQLQTEASLTLSISQEADEAIDRAQRWLAAQQAPTNRVDAILRAYALAMPNESAFRITRCDITPLEHAMPPPEMPESYTNLTATLEQVRGEPKRLFALQRDIPTEAPPPNWREALALTLINTQKIAQNGGHWGSNDNTIWAILTLRALLNESIPVQLAE